MMIQSPIFGETKYPSDAESAVAEGLVELMPIAFFQALNKKLNTLGMCIIIKTIEEVPA